LNRLSRFIRACRPLPGRAPGKVPVIVCLVVLVLAAGPLLANGGTLRVANVPMGDYLVSVFTDPTPVRPDSLDVSILILQDGFDGVPDGVEVQVRAASVEHPQMASTQRATREQADDSRYYAAKFGLGHPGSWSIEVEVRGDAGEGRTSFEVTAREAGLLGNPLVLILLSLLPLAVAGWWLTRGTNSR